MVIILSVTVGPPPHCRCPLWMFPYSNYHYYKDYYLIFSILAFQKYLIGVTLCVFMYVSSHMVLPFMVWYPVKWAWRVNDLIWVHMIAMQFIHSFITSIYIVPLQVGLLSGAPNPNTTKENRLKLRKECLRKRSREWAYRQMRVSWDHQLHGGSP